MVTAPLAYLIGWLGRLCIEAEGRYGSGPWSVFPGLLSDAGRGVLPAFIAGLAILGMGTGIVAAVRSRSAASIRAMQCLAVLLLLAAVVTAGFGVMLHEHGRYGIYGWWGDELDLIQDLTLPVIRIAVALSFVGLAVGWILSAIVEARRPVE